MSRFLPTTHKRPLPRTTGPLLILPGSVQRPRTARLSAFSGLAVLAGFFGGFFLPSPVAGIWFAVVVGWAWLSVTSWCLRRYMGHFAA